MLCRHIRTGGQAFGGGAVAIGADPAIEWIIDRYQVRTDPDSGITNDPSAYSGDPRYIIDLLRRVITVSLNTLDVTDQLEDREGTAS